MPYRIEKIVAEGFRGFRKKSELKFEQPLVILYGPQRSGKSSVLNAPVWALIGSEATKVNLGPVQIRERAGWLAENLEARDCRVEIVLREANGSGRLVIERSRGRDNYVVRRNGGEVEETPLAALRLTLDGLVSSVFLPQEVVRAALSVEPRHRRAIFTQLAGLEDLRSLEECLKKAREKLEKSADKVARLREEIDTAVKAQVSIQTRRIKELSERVRTLGLPDEALSPDGVRALVEQAVVALEEFCRKYSMEMLTLPDVGGPDELPGFVGQVRSALSKFEASSPETRRQKDLYEKQHEIEGLVLELQKIKVEREQINSQRQKIIKSHGTEEDLKLAIQELEEELQKIDDEIDRAGKYLKMIQEALAYFDTLPEVKEMECPVCRKARVTVAHVREHLAAEIGKAGLEPLRRRKEEIDKNLRQKREAQKQLLDLAKQDRKLEERREELVKKVGELRGQPVEAHESIDLVLEKIKRKIDSELKKLEGLLEARNEAISHVRQELDKLGVVDQLHRENLRLEELDNIPNLPEYGDLLEVEDELERHVGLLTELERCVNEEIEQAFREKFAALKDKVNELYRRLVGREDFPEIWIDVKNWEVLASAGKTGIGVTRVFNVGDITAVALCLFLASAMRASHDAGFILLDDPIQSLDEEHETRLAEILAELAEQRQVVVSCSRTSFLKALETAGTVSRQVIRLAAWDSDRSCRFEGEATED